MILYAYINSVDFHTHSAN